MFYCNSPNSSQHVLSYENQRKRRRREDGYVAGCKFYTPGNHDCRAHQPFFEDFFPHKRESCGLDGDFSSHDRLAVTGNAIQIEDLRKQNLQEFDGIRESSAFPANERRHKCTYDRRVLCNLDRKFAADFLNFSGHSIDKRCSRVISPGGITNAGFSEENAQLGRLLLLRRQERRLLRQHRVMEDAMVSGRTITRHIKRSHDRLCLDDRRPYRGYIYQHHRRIEKFSGHSLSQYYNGAYDGNISSVSSLCRGNDSENDLVHSEIRRCNNINYDSENSGNDQDRFMRGGYYLNSDGRYVSSFHRGRSILPFQENSRRITSSFNSDLDDAGAESSSYGETDVSSSTGETEEYSSSGETEQYSSNSEVDVSCSNSEADIISSANEVDGSGCSSATLTSEKNVLYCFGDSEGVSNSDEDLNIHENSIYSFKLTAMPKSCTEVLKCEGIAACEPKLCESNKPVSKSKAAGPEGGRESLAEFAGNISSNSHSDDVSFSNNRASHMQKGLPMVRDVSRRSSSLTRDFPSMDKIQQVPYFRDSKLVNGNLALNRATAVNTNSAISTPLRFNRRSFGSVLGEQPCYGHKASINLCCSRQKSMTKVFSVSEKDDSFNFKRFKKAVRYWIDAAMGHANPFWVFLQSIPGAVGGLWSRITGTISPDVGVTATSASGLLRGFAKTEDFGMPLLLALLTVDNQRKQEERQKNANFTNQELQHVGRDSDVDHIYHHDICFGSSRWIIYQHLLSLAWYFPNSKCEFLGAFCMRKDGRQRGVDGLLQQQLILLLLLHVLEDNDIRALFFRPDVLPGFLLRCVRVVASAQHEARQSVNEKLCAVCFPVVCEKKRVCWLLQDVSWILRLVCGWCLISLGSQMETGEQNSCGSFANGEDVLMEFQRDAMEILKTASELRQKLAAQAEGRLPETQEPQIATANSMSSPSSENASGGLYPDIGNLTQLMQMCSLLNQSKSTSLCFDDDESFGKQVQHMSYFEGETSRWGAVTLSCLWAASSTRSWNVCGVCKQRIELKSSDDEPGSFDTAWDCSTVFSKPAEEFQASLRFSHGNILMKVAADAVRSSSVAAAAAAFWLVSSDSREQQMMAEKQGAWKVWKAMGRWRASYNWVAERSGVVYTGMQGSDATIMELIRSAVDVKDVNGSVTTKGIVESTSCQNGDGVLYLAKTAMQMLLQQLLQLEKRLPSARFLCKFESFYSDNSLQRGSRFIFLNPEGSETGWSLTNGCGCLSWFLYMESFYRGHGIKYIIPKPFALHILLQLATAVPINSLGMMEVFWPKRSRIGPLDSGAESISVSRCPCVLERYVNPPLCKNEEIGEMNDEKLYTSENFPQDQRKLNLPACFVAISCMEALIPSVKDKELNLPLERTHRAVIELYFGCLHGRSNFHGRSQDHGEKECLQPLAINKNFADTNFCLQQSSYMCLLLMLLWREIQSDDSLAEEAHHLDCMPSLSTTTVISMGQPSDSFVYTSAVNEADRHSGALEDSRCQLESPGCQRCKCCRSRNTYRYRSVLVSKFLHLLETEGYKGIPVAILLSRCRNLFTKSRTGRININGRESQDFTMGRVGPSWPGGSNAIPGKVGQDGWRFPCAESFGFRFCRFVAFRLCCSLACDSALKRLLHPEVGIMLSSGTNELTAEVFKVKVDTVESGSQNSPICKNQIDISAGLYDDQNKENNRDIWGKDLKLHLAASTINCTRKNDNSHIKQPLPSCDSKSFFAPLKRCYPKEGEDKDIRMDCGTCEKQINLPIGDQSNTLNIPKSIHEPHEQPRHDDSTTEEYSCCCNNTSPLQGVIHRNSGAVSDVSGVHLGQKQLKKTEVEVLKLLRLLRFFSTGGQLWAPESGVRKNRSYFGTFVRFLDEALSLMFPSVRRHNFSLDSVAMEKHRGDEELQQCNNADMAVTGGDSSEHAVDNDKCTCVARNRHSFGSHCSTNTEGDQSVFTDDEHGSLFHLEDNNLPSHIQNEALLVKNKEQLVLYQMALCELLDIRLSASSSLVPERTAETLFCHVLAKCCLLDRSSNTFTLKIFRQFVYKISQSIGCAAMVFLLSIGACIRCPVTVNERGRQVESSKRSVLRSCLSTIISAISGYRIALLGLSDFSFTEHKHEINRSHALNAVRRGGDDGERFVQNITQIHFIEFAFDLVFMFKVVLDFLQAEGNHYDSNKNSSSLLSTEFEMNQRTKKKHGNILSGRGRLQINNLAKATAGAINQTISFLEEVKGTWYDSGCTDTKNDVVADNFDVFSISLNKKCDFYEFIDNDDKTLENALNAIRIIYDQLCLRISINDKMQDDEKLELCIGDDVLSSENINNTDVTRTEADELELTESDRIMLEDLIDYETVDPLSLCHTNNTKISKKTLNGNISDHYKKEDQNNNETFPVKDYQSRKNITQSTTSGDICKQLLRTKAARYPWFCFINGLFNDVPPPKNVFSSSSSRKKPKP